jgi:tetratricopeptide (TPR) repeat protein
MAKLRWAVGQPAAAVAELRDWMGSAGDAADEYWELLAELAWDQELDEVAVRAYEALWRSRRIGVTGAERLILLSQDAGRTAEVIRYGREGWSRLGEPRLLLLAMDEAARAGRWEDVARLNGEAMRSPRDFAAFPTYWMLRARLDERAGRIASAAEHYRRALGVDPGSPAARSGLIWLYVAARDRSALSESLAAWASDAADEPELWRPFAAGLELLGRREDALAFYERAARANPDDREAADLYLRALRLPREDHGTTVVADLGVQSFGPVTWRRLDAMATSHAGSARLQLRARRSDFTSSDPMLRLEREGSELLARVHLPLFGGRTELAGGVIEGRERNALQGAVAHTQPLASFAEARLDAAVNEPADESAVLMVEGLRSRVGGALTVTAGRAYGRAGAELKRWSSREGGGELASGGAGTLEIGVREHRADTEISLRLYGSHQRNELPVTPDPAIAALAPGVTLLPEELSMLGIGASAAGVRLGPARLLADAWLGWISPPHRSAYRLQAGLAFAPFERAELSVTGFTANDRFGARGDYGVSVSLAYRISELTR